MNKEDKFKQFKAVDEACQAFLHELEQGKEYRLLHIAKNEADQTEFAVYKDDKGQIWTRPLVEFNEKFKPLRRADG